MCQQMQTVTKDAKIPKFTFSCLYLSWYKKCVNLHNAAKYLHAFAYPSLISILKNNLHKFCAQSGIDNASSFL